MIKNLKFKIQKYKKKIEAFYRNTILFIRKIWTKWNLIEEFDIYQVKYDYLCNYHKRFRIYIYTIFSTYIFEVVDYDFEENVQICEKFIEIRSEIIFWIFVFHFFFCFLSLFKTFQCFLFTYMFFIKETLLICLVFDVIIVYCFFTEVYFFSTSPIVIKTFLLILILFQFCGIISIFFFKIAKLRFKKYKRKKWKNFLNF